MYKKDIQRISQHIGKTQTNSCIMTFCSAVFHAVDVDRIVGKSTAPSTANILSTDPILFTCVLHHLAELCLTTGKELKLWKELIYPLTCNRLRTAVKNTEAEPVFRQLIVFVIIIAVNMNSMLRWNNYMLVENTHTSIMACISWTHKKGNTH